jgi:tRNA(Ile)-lysidine synthase
MFTKSQLDFLADKKLALACSGGIDSMVLGQILLSHGFKFDLIHCNFQLRGASSNLDEEFVESFAEENKLNFFVRRYDTANSAKRNQTSIEIEARNLRYRYFEELINQEKLDLVLLAHHRHDQAETIFMRLIKGAGIVGLSGMKELRNHQYYRPLLNISKEDILIYSKENQIQFREDETNKETIYQRNKIRNQILPLIEEINPSYQDALIQVGDISAQTLGLLHDNFNPLKANWNESEKVNLKQYATKNYLPLILSYILEKEIQHKTQLETIVQVLSGKESKIFNLLSCEIEVKNFHISRVSRNYASPISYLNLDEVLHSKELTASISQEFPSMYKNGSLYMDINKLQFPLLYRSMQPKDKMKVFGMNGRSKKLSDIAQELNWTVNDKLSNKVFLDGDNEIIAILGYRISEKVKIDHSSHQILMIQRP